MKIDSRQKNGVDSGSYVLLFGGKGYEKDVSVSGACQFLKTAEKINFDFIPIFIDAYGDFYIFNGRAEDIQKINHKRQKRLLTPTSFIRFMGKSGFLKDGKIIPVKLVFPLLHGDYGEDGVIQGLLSALGISFVGADNFAGAVATDKVYSKIIARCAGVPTLPEIVISSDSDIEAVCTEAEKSFGFPVFVKPARLGSSIGASVSKSRQEFLKSVRKALSLAERVMVEPAVLCKRELECAYYNVGRRKIITPPGEICVGTGFYDFALKYKRSKDVELSARANVTDEVKEKIISYTDTLAKAIGIRHIARFDYFLLPDGRIYFNEVNTMPGMTVSSLYPAMLLGEGVDFSDFILSFREYSD